MTDEFLQVKKALEKLPGALQEKVVVGATRAAAKAVADEAKERVPVRTGLLKKSIGVAKAKKRDTELGHVKFYVVPKSKIAFTAKGKVDGMGVKVKTKTHAYYAHMVEFGTKNMAARPFLRPAFEDSADKSVDAFQEYALKRVEKEVRKLAR
ncbi:MAG: HK97-gp10 family putative phage morphogenesis protein [Sulfurimonas sp.]